MFPTLYCILVNNYPVYKDLEPTNLYDFDTVRDMYSTIIETINDLYEYLNLKNTKMVNDGKPGSSSYMSGAYTKITTNGSVAPQYQGYTIHTANGPFCFIPRN